MFTDQPASRRGGTRAVWCAVALLLGLYAAMALTASTHQGLSFDEGEQLAVGYNIWLRQDFRMESANGDLVKRWATLPFLVTQPNLPSADDPDWKKAEPYVLGFNFFFRSGNSPEALLLQGRAMIVLLGVALGALVFVCARGLFGTAGGFVSLGLFVFSPHMLAHGAMVSTEMSICLTLLGSTWCIWRLLHRVTWARLLGSLGCFGLLLLAKPTALVIFPITAVLLAVRLSVGRPLEWSLGRQRVIASRWAQTGVFAGMIVLHAVVGWAAIWAHYDFRYAASPRPDDPTVQMRIQTVRDEVGPIPTAIIAWSRETHFLPQGFLAGIKWLLRQDERRPAFMDGEWTLGGWSTFFPYAIWVKSSLVMLAMLGVGLGGWWWARRAPQAGATGRAYEIAPYVVLIAVYFAIALTQELNIGHRHILPPYPAIYVLAGSAAWLWYARALWGRVVLGLAGLWLVRESVSVYPHYLAYFNRLSGGPTSGYRHLVDSSLDWGMNLPELKQWLDANNPAGRTPLYLAYFGTDSPESRGIASRRLPGFFDWRPKDVYPLGPGIYAISATLLQSVYTTTFGPWNRAYEQTYQESVRQLAVLDRTAGDPTARAALFKQYPVAYWEAKYAEHEQLRFGRLCAWLRHRRAPDAQVGYAILIWRLTEADLRAALIDPPAELEAEPVTAENSG